MDEERFASSMHHVDDPAEPRPEFLAELRAELAAELGYIQPDGVVKGRARPTRPAGRTRRQSNMRIVWLAAAVYVALSIGAAAVFVGSRSNQPLATPASSDLLTTVQASGVLSIAVRPDFPQVTSNGADHGGFDEDVARELANRLSLTDAIRAIPESGILRPPAVDGWDIAMPSRALTAAELSAQKTSTPYYYWPVYLAVSSTSTITAPADLAGQRICAVGGSAGQAWLAGTLAAETTGVVATPPSALTVVVAATDDECLSTLAAGSVAAAVTSTSSAADLGTRNGIRGLASPVFIEARRIVITGPGDGTTLRAAVDAALSAMQADGTLADLSRRRFGTQDLSSPPQQ